MGNGSVTIDYEVLAIASGILAAVGGLLGWLARTYFKRMDRDRDELNERMDRDRDELNKRMVRDKAEVIDMLKQSDKRSSENFQAINGQLETLRGETRDSLRDVDKKIDGTRKELDEKGEKRHGETRDALQKLDDKVETLRGETRDSLRDVDKKIDSTRKELDEKGEKRHGETLNTLINLTLQGGRHEGPGRVKDDSAARLGQHSPRRNDEPSSTRDVEADPEPDAVHNDISMVPVPGSGTEPAHAPGLMHQAAPGPKQAPQRIDETGTEPDAEESAETAP